MNQETSKCAMIRLNEAQHTCSLLVTNQFSVCLFVVSFLLFFFLQNGSQHDVHAHTCIVIFKISNVF